MAGSRDVISRSLPGSRTGEKRSLIRRPSADEVNLTTARLCSVVTIIALAAVPTLRFLPGAAGRGDAGFVMTAPGNGGRTVVTADNIREKAEPLLARMTAEPGEIFVTAGPGSGCDGETHHQWYVNSRATSSRMPGDGDSTELAEVRYDATTGGLIYACTAFGVPDRRTRSGGHPLTAEEAVQVARRWLPKLGFVPSGNADAIPTVVFPPQRLPATQWRVWLRAKETPDGPDLTVQVAVTSSTGAFLFAAVVERAETPLVYLPRRF